MMQALLEERFKLTLHKVAKEIPAFELTVGADGPKLRPAKEGGCVVDDRNNPPPNPSPGAAPDPSSPFTPGDGGAIANAVKKLGLQMHYAKRLAEFLVIDHVEMPSEN